MVHLLDGHGASFLQALLAQGMDSDVGVSDAFPRPAVALGRFRIALVLVVVPVDGGFATYSGV